MRSNKKTTENSTVIVLPETDERTLCVEFTDLISLEDYKQNFRAPLKMIIEKNGGYSVLVNHGSTFKGWEENAADLSMQTIIEFAKYGHRRAIINPPNKFIMMQKMSGELFGGETRYFEKDHFQEALNWVKSGKMKR